MRSTNPILTRSEAFQPATSYGQQQGAPYAQAPYNQAPYSQAPYNQAPYKQQGYPQPGYGVPPTAPPTGRTGLMTIDDVIIKTAILFAAMLAVAAGIYFGYQAGIIPLGMVMGSAVVGALASFVISMIVAFRRTVSPAFAIIVSLLEGLFVGGISAVFELYYPGIVAQAVFGTFCAALVVFAAYKFLRVRVTSTMMRVVFVATIGFAVLALASLVFSLFGVNLGLFASVTGPVGGLAWAFCLLGLALAAFNLIIDFQLIDDGIRNGAPASESWRAAYGLLVTMVWLYLQILRLLSYIRR